MVFAFIDFKMGASLDFLGKSLHISDVCSIFHINLMLFAFYISSIIKSLIHYWHKLFFIYYHYNHIFCLHNISDRSIKALGISELDSYVQTLIEYMKLQKKKVLQEQIINIAKYYRDFK